MDTNKEILERGTVLGGKWEILRRVGVGGKGAIYLARQIALDRDVAVKIMSPEFLSSLEEDEEEQTTERERFRREVLAMARVRHPNVLQVFDYETSEVDGHSLEYIVMEYVPGSTLRSSMPVDGFREDEAAIRKWIAEFFLPVLDGLEVVHDQGIIHRDMKPENILLDGATPKITDFGLAGGRVWTPLTRSHHSLGTLIYMAPEQFTEMDLTDARADIYALGKILYEAVVGKLGRENARPFQPVSLDAPGSPFLKELNRIIEWATARNPDERLPSVAAFRNACSPLLNTGTQYPARMGTPWTGRKKSFFIIGGILVFSAVIAVAIYFGKVWITPGTTSGSIISDAGRDISQALPPKPWSPGNSYTGADGAILHFVPGAGFTLVNSTDGADRQVLVASFFMGENEVTNHQYIEFLNQVLDRLKVTEGVVKFGDDIWLLLGEVDEGYEPLVFDGSRFRITNPTFASYPVVRVTATGAQAYAEFYGRRLPRLEEWYHAAGARHLKTVKPDAETGTPPANDSIMHHMDGMSAGNGATSDSSNLGPVGLGPPERFGLRGLDSGVGEWAVDEGQAPNPAFVVMGGPQGTGGAAEAVHRRPWEAFSRVGFRTVYQPD